MAGSQTDDATKLVLKYVEFAAEGSNRSRLVLLALLIASVATFLASWNIRDEAWLKARLQVEEDVLRWWRPLHAGQPPPLLDANRLKRFHQARLYFAQRLSGGDAVDSTRIQQEVQVLRQVRIEDLLTLRMPFFGVVVDLNDLTLVSGVSFSAILGWLSFALLSERRNLRFLFCKAKEWGKLPLCYDLLSMRQVLSHPPLEGDNPDHHLSWRPKLLILLPLGVQLFVLFHHYDTLRVAESINTDAAGNGFTLVLLTSALMLGLGFRCLWISFETDIEWGQRAKELIHLRRTPSLAEELDLFPDAGQF